LVTEFGIAGAAGAWALRVTFDALLLFWAAFRIYGLPMHLLETNGAILAGISIMILAIAGFVLKTASDAFSIYYQSIFIILLLILFAGVVWNCVLDITDRNAILKIANIKNKQETI